MLQPNPNTVVSGLASQSGNMDAGHSAQDQPDSTTSSEQTAESRRAARAPKRLASEEMKSDPDYREKRRRNNEAAKKSRDSKRNVSATLLQKLQLLEDENVRLKAEYHELVSEINNLHLQLNECDDLNTKL